MPDFVYSRRGSQEQPQSAAREDARESTGMGRRFTAYQMPYAGAPDKMKRDRIGRARVTRLVFDRTAIYGYARNRAQ